MKSFWNIYCERVVAVRGWRLRRRYMYYILWYDFCWTSGQDYYANVNWFCVQNIRRMINSEKEFDHDRNHQADINSLHRNSSQHFHTRLCLIHLKPLEKYIHRMVFEIIP